MATARMQLMELCQRKHQRTKNEEAGRGTCCATICQSSKSVMNTQITSALELTLFASPTVSTCINVTLIPKPNNKSLRDSIDSILERGAFGHAHVLLVAG